MNFYEPQRQSAIGIVVNFLYGVQKFARAFVPLIVLFFFKQDGLKNDRTLLIVFFILLFLLVTSYLNYKYFTFFVDKETQAFIINKGFINKKRITIQLNRIQQVNIYQSFINKLVGIYSIEVDSAGSNDKEGVIRSVSKEVADQLKQLLLAQQEKENVEEHSITQQEPVTEYGVGILTLLKVGVTSNYLYTIGVLLLFVNTLLNEVSKFFNKELDDEAIDLFIEKDLTIVIGVVLVCMFFLTVFIVNIGRTLLKFYNYKIKEEKQTLLLSHGLLATRSTLIKPNRVQRVVIEQNYFQKLWNIANFKINQVAENTAIQKKAAMEIPGCSTEEKHAFFKLIFNKPLAIEGTTLKYNYRYFGFRFFVLVCLPVFLFALLFRQAFSMQEFLGILISYSVVVTAIIYRLFRVGRLIVNKDFIIIRKGVWDVSHTIFEIHKIQKLELHQLFWQKGANVGSINIYTAGGTMRFSTTDYNQLKEFLDQWVYQLESENKAWM
ncbi:MAG: PH domain-containing protein [Flavobacteriaceae bacterium]|jgi:putative membrane protein|nr:PH domain-containing protein [Flavobacteriaceae bacterium]